MGRAMSTQDILFPITRLSEAEQLAFLPDAQSPFAKALPDRAAWRDLLRQHNFLVEDDGETLTVTPQDAGLESPQWVTLRTADVDAALVSGDVTLLFPVLDGLGQVIGTIGLAMNGEAYMSFPRLPSKMGGAAMKIERLTLPTPDLGAQRAFYVDLLGFAVEADGADGLTLRTGSTLLRFVPGEAAGPYHFAFNVPEDRFHQARAWLEERVTLLSDETGETTFHSENWNADIAYFRDADGNILEFIARHILPAMPGDSFGVDDVLGLSELGLPVASVPEAVRDLQNRYGLPIYGGTSPTFTALGDEEGLLIVVPVGRGWFPTGEPAHRLPFQLRAHGGNGPFDLEEHP